MNLEEMQRMYMRDGQVFTVSATPKNPPAEPPVVTAQDAAAAPKAGSK